jgi:orotidine-5'-phosphate decarboxylase
MIQYLDLLQNVYAKKNTMLCFGMDPVVERMKIDNSKTLTDEIVTYFTRIFDAIADKISAVKPNVAFYLQYGMDGISALVQIIKKVKSEGMPVIIDAKLGDIGRTAEAYAKYIFEYLGGDSVTLSPYLGYDSLEPFFKYQDRGFYLLALTSNKGAGDFQLVRIETGAYLYGHVLGTISGWSEKVKAAGAVIGATQNEFRECIELLKTRNCYIPLLIPGVGAQGGSYSNIKTILEELEYNLGIVRINASSSISYAHEKFKSLTVEEASFRAVEELLG